jgi:hypothetical protein
MLLEMFFNELSVTPLAADVESGQMRVEQFVRTMIVIASRGVRPMLRIPEDFFVKPIAPGYDWYKWLNDNRVDRQLRQYLRSLGTEMPFLRDQGELEAEWAGIDCFCRNQKALGLKAAYVADGLAVSLLSRQEWDNPFIDCEIQEITGEDIECRLESIHHASNVQHADTHRDWIFYRIRNAVKNGKELWRYVTDFFPALDNCSVVEEQMVNLPANSLPSIMRGLFHLNDYCRVWRSGAFDPNAVACNVSLESEQTLQMFSAERTFLCPDGKKRVFSWHAKVGQWRIYFDPAQGPGNLLIGYVGKHLRTARFR